MTWKSYVPFYGDKTVRKKLNEIESEAATLPVILGIFFAKIFESIIIGSFGLALRFFMGCVTVAAIYLYKHEMKQKGEQVKEKAEEKVEDITEEDNG